MVHTFIVWRDSEDEFTFAIVKAISNKPRNQIFPAIRQACSSWIQETDEGLRAWQNSSEDFNVGDLSCEIDYSKVIKDDSIEYYLLKCGIDRLEIECHVYEEIENDWTYDMVLAEKPDADLIADRHEAEEYHRRKITEQD